MDSSLCSCVQEKPVNHIRVVEECSLTKFAGGIEKFSSQRECHGVDEKHSCAFIIYESYVTKLLPHLFFTLIYSLSLSFMNPSPNNCISLLLLFNHYYLIFAGFIY